MNPNNCVSLPHGSKNAEKPALSVHAPEALLSDETALFFIEQERFSSNFQYICIAKQSNPIATRHVSKTRNKTPFRTPFATDTAGLRRQNAPR